LIVFDDEPQGHPVVETIRFGERQRFADLARKALPERVIQAFDMSSLPGFLANRVMLRRRQPVRITLPSIGKPRTSAVCQRDALPHLLTTGRVALAQEKTDDLAGPATQGDPQPAFLGFAGDKRPEFIQFEYLLRLSGQQGLDQQREGYHLMLDPARDGLPMPAKHALQATQTDAFLTGFQDRLLTLGRRLGFGLEHAIGSTVFAMVLRIAAFVFTLADDVNAPASSTRKRGGFLYHVGALSSPHHLLFNHYPHFKLGVTWQKLRLKASL
jgi:hypothetical protein